MSTLFKIAASFNGKFEEELTELETTIAQHLVNEHLLVVKEPRVLRNVYVYKDGGWHHRQRWPNDAKMWGLE